MAYTPDSQVGFRVEEIGLPECPYLKRWLLQLGRFSLRLHHWRASDDPRHLHDHPWWFITLVLRGGYTDVSSPRPDAIDLGEKLFDLRAERLRPGSIRYRPARHAHTVQVGPEGAWTLLLTGPQARDWGFWINGVWLRQRKYFRTVGHHPCED